MGSKFSLPDLNGSYQIVMIGLDNAGKSTILYRLQAQHFVQTPPTIGFNCEKFKPSSGKAKGNQFTIWDVGGQEKLRPLWRSYVRHTDAIVFVVDSTEGLERTEEAKLELSNLMRSADIPSAVPLLLMANKQDLPGAFAAEDLEQRLGISDNSIVNRTQNPTLTIPCCAVTGEGLETFFDDLHALIGAAKKAEKSNRKKSSAQLHNNNSTSTPIK